MAISPRPVTGDAKRWKAMSHPLRREMLRQLAEHGTASSTTLAAALGESTGTTSYHLRVLADAGVIEEAPGQTNGRERWWRVPPVDLREPDYDSLDGRTGRRSTNGALRRSPARWTCSTATSAISASTGRGPRSSRANGYYTAADLDAFMNEYIGLLNKYGHTAETAPPDARLMQLRMFYIPDEPAEPEEIGQLNKSRPPIANVRLLTISQAVDENGQRRPLFTGGAGQVVQTLQRTGGLARDVAHSTDKRSPVKMNHRSFFKRSA